MSATIDSDIFRNYFACKMGGKMIKAPLKSIYKKCQITEMEGSNFVILRKIFFSNYI
jgi:hypothetical protein